MKMSGMKVLAVVLLVLAIGFAVWGACGQKESYLFASACFVISMALLANISKSAKDKIEDGEDK